MLAKVLPSALRNQLDTSAIWWLASTARAVLDTELLLLDDRRLDDLLARPETAALVQRLLASEDSQSQNGQDVQDAKKPSATALLSAGLRLLGVSVGTVDGRVTLQGLKGRSDGAVLQQRRTSTLTTLLFLQRLASHTPMDYLCGLSARFLGVKLNPPSSVAPVAAQPPPQPLAVAGPNQPPQASQTIVQPAPAPPQKENNVGFFFKLFGGSKKQAAPAVTSGTRPVTSGTRPTATPVAKPIPVRGIADGEYKKLAMDTYAESSNGPVLLYDSVSLCLQLLLPRLHLAINDSASALTSPAPDSPSSSTSTSSSSMPLVSPLVSNLVHATIAHVVVKVALSVLLANPAWVDELEALVRAGPTEKGLSPHSQAVLAVICETARQLVPKNGGTGAQLASNAVGVNVNQNPINGLQQVPPKGILKKPQQEAQTGASPAQRMSAKLELVPRNTPANEEQELMEMLELLIAGAIAENEGGAHGGVAAAPKPHLFSSSQKRNLQENLRTNEDSPLRFNEGNALIISTRTTSTYFF